MNHHPRRFTYKLVSTHSNNLFRAMDVRLKHPFPAIVAEPTCCGKTQFVKLLLESGEDVFHGV